MSKEISQYFSNKRVLSSASDDGDVAKKLREGSLDDTNSDNSENPNNVEVFHQDTNEEPNVVEILKNLQQQITEIHSMAKNNEERQIKGDCQLGELVKSVEFINKKFEEYENTRKEKDEIIKNLRNDVANLSGTIVEMEKSLDKQEQYSRRNCLLIHGVKERKNENTDDLVVDIIKNDLGEDINVMEIDRSHRIGKVSNKSRPIIVKFSRYNSRKKLFSNKKKLKGTNYSITESLTKFRMTKLQEARELHGFKNVWTFDGRILYKDTDSDTVKVYYD